MNIPFFQEILTAFHIEHYIIHDSDDKEKKAAWTINTKIWENVQASNNFRNGMYIFIILRITWNQGEVR